MNNTIMIQVQLKIEEFFHLPLIVRYADIKSVKEAELRNKIEHKLKYFEYDTRENAIKALWDSQKSMLPKDKYLKINHFNLNKKIEIIDCVETVSNNYFTDAKVDNLDVSVATFYNPETRIITITDFEEAV